ncbi:hypothetical protein, partial [Mesorhizobium sp. M2D.F.Ca.ET.140.01.1.1]|uniref:hypothetical protein n=1 Tax=Mesorhizobium sp. M2D.F.Ca.ET.140.01.1.1 TaxID=2496664 RepID=UPI001AECC265
MRRIDIKSLFASSRAPQAGLIVLLPSRTFVDKSFAQSFLLELAGLASHKGTGFGIAEPEDGRRLNADIVSLCRDA